MERHPTSSLGALCNTARALVAHTSETASLALAELVIRRYEALKPAERLGFLSFMLDELGPSGPEVDMAIESYHAAPTQMAAARLARAAEGRRQALFRAINAAPGGTWTVLGLRADTLAALAEHPELAPVEADLFHVLSSWFNRGFIVLKRISWRSSGAVLERLIEYEAVHEIRGWDDLRRRLEADRRCFGFFHPAIPDEPLIFVEVALAKGSAWSIGELLDAPLHPGDEKVADTAIFYSITNCQGGLRGIALGGFLIKQVVRELKAELPKLEQFLTLSPIPGFASWLAAGGGEGVTEADRRVLEQLADPGWFEDRERAETLRPVLLRACARYLVLAKRGAQPADPVARFHLRNGARLQRINWLGDTSPKGKRESHGMVVNYVYDEGQIDANHEAYVHDGIVARSPEIDALLAG